MLKVCPKNQLIIINPQTCTEHLKAAELQLTTTIRSHNRQTASTPNTYTDTNLTQIVHIPSHSNYSHLVSASTPLLINTPPNEVQSTSYYFPKANESLPSLSHMQPKQHTIDCLDCFSLSINKKTQKYYFQLLMEFQMASATYSTSIGLVHAEQKTTSWESEYYLCKLEAFSTPLRLLHRLVSLIRNYPIYIPQNSPIEAYTLSPDECEELHCISTIILYMSFYELIAAQEKSSCNGLVFTSLIFQEEPFKTIFDTSNIIKLYYQHLILPPLIPSLMTPANESLFTKKLAKDFQLHTNSEKSEKHSMLQVEAETKISFTERLARNLQQLKSGKKGKNIAIHQENPNKIKSRYTEYSISEDTLSAYSMHKQTKKSEVALSLLGHDQLLSSNPKHPIKNSAVPPAAQKTNFQYIKFAKITSQIDISITPLIDAIELTSRKKRSIHGTSYTKAINSLYASFKTLNTKDEHTLYLPCLEFSPSFEVVSQNIMQAHSTTISIVAIKKKQAVEWNKKFELYATSIEPIQVITSLQLALPHLQGIEEEEITDKQNIMDEFNTFLMKSIIFPSAPLKTEEEKAQYKDLMLKILGINLAANVYNRLSTEKTRGHTPACCFNISLLEKISRVFTKNQIPQHINQDSAIQPATYLHKHCEKAKGILNFLNSWKIKLEPSP